MWIVFERLCVLLVIIFVITQVLIPSFIPSLRYFWIFKKSNKLISEQLNRIDDLQDAEAIILLRKQADELEEKLKKESKDGPA